MSSLQPNDHNESGLRLLSIDGGGIRGLSSLLMLKEILYRMQQQRQLPDLQKPCDIFNLAAGTGTGGIIVIMLFRLQMSIDEAITAYESFARQIFSEKKWFFQSGVFKASRLESAMLQMIQDKLGMDEVDARGVRMLNEPGSKCFVCAVPAEDSRFPTLFRSWMPTENPNYDCTIVEAARATTASPSFFKGIKVGEPIKQKYTDAGLMCNNPVKYLLGQARTHFGPSCRISCVVSLGTGTENVIRLAPQPDAFQKMVPTKLIGVLRSIAEDCERISEEAAIELSQANHSNDGSPLYVRLNVNNGLQDVSLAEWEKMPQVQAHTTAYLQTRDVNTKVDSLVKTLNGPQSGTPTQATSSRSAISPSERLAFEKLTEKIAIRAYHDAQEQVTDGTRVAELDTFRRFIRRNDRSKPFLVVLGPAGSGKTSLLGSIARACKEDNHHVATFFFSRNEKERNTEAFLVNTLIYQIGVALPQLQPYIGRAIEPDPTILSRPLETQLSALLIEPLDHYLTDHPNVALPPCVLLIDALDECGTYEVQRNVILKLYDALTRLSFPFRCVFSCRFDSHGLHSLFSREPIQQLVFDQVILGTGGDTEMADIRSYLDASIKQIRRVHRFASDIPEDWPSDSDLDDVVNKSGGQFIYAATVVRYIDSPFHRPQERLRTILGMHTLRSTDRPFAPLDELYWNLLSSVEELDTALLFLGLELARSCPQLWIPETFLDEDGDFLKQQFCGWDADVVLAPLAPVLHCARGCIQLHHLAFAEYLFDSARSGKHFSDQLQRCQTWVVGQLVQFFYDDKFIYRTDVEHLIKEAKPGTILHDAVETGSNVVVDKPEPLPAKGKFNIWPLVAKAFLTELNIHVFNGDLFNTFHNYGDHIPLPILIKLASRYGLDNFFIIIELCKTFVVLQQEGLVQVDWCLSRPDHERLSRFINYLSQYLDDVHLTYPIIPTDSDVCTACRCLWYLQRPTSVIQSSVKQELTLLENISNLGNMDSDSIVVNIAQGALDLFPKLLNQTSSPSDMLLVALQIPLEEYIALMFPSSVQNVEDVIRAYLSAKVKTGITSEPGGLLVTQQE